MNRKEFVRILERIKPGLSSKEITESMTYFFFSGTHVITYNDKISIQHPLKTDFKLFVKATDLFKIVSKLTADEITLAEVDGKLNLKCKSLNAKLATIEDDEVNARISHVTKQLEKAKWKKLPKDFCNGISLCAFAASKEESESTTTCVYVDKNQCIASDNRRIAHAEMSEEVPAPMFVKASEIRHLIPIEPVKYSNTKSWTHFKNKEGCVFSIMKIEGDFPDFLQFFDFDGTKINLPKNLTEGLDIASILADDSDPHVSIKIKKGFCHIIVKSDSGTVNHRTKIDYKGEEIDFSINPAFLKKLIGYSSSMTISDDMIKISTDNGFELVSTLYAEG